MVHAPWHIVVACVLWGFGWGMFIGSRWGHAWPVPEWWPRHRKMCGDKAPQRQCAMRDRHERHVYVGPTGLVWSCQGRGGSS